MHDLNLIEFRCVYQRDKKKTLVKDKNASYFVIVALKYKDICAWCGANFLVIRKNIV